MLSGAQQGLDLLARCLIDPGDAVILDRPGYLGAIQSFRAAGAKLIGWDIARADSDELEDLIVRYRPKLIYTNPSFHNPTGATLPIRTRREVLSLAQRYRIPIVEDATYQDLYFNEPPPPSLRELDDHNLVIYLNSFSKVMAPGLRLGWIAAAPSIVEQIAIIKQRLDPHTPNLVQMAVARMMRQGTSTRTCGRCARSTQALHADDRHPPAPHAAGIDPLRAPGRRPLLWCRLGAGLSATALHERALASGVTFVPGPAFYPDPAGDSELRLCFTSVLPATVEESIKRLARCIGEVRLTA